MKNEYCYDAFGNGLDIREDIHNRITYTGQQFDGITNQYYLRARFYNPVIGRFTQEDVYRGDGLNLYAYCGNNPVGYFDPSGYKSKCGSKTQAINGTEEVCKPKTYQTYTKVNTKTGEVYSGRTSGKGTPLENVANRDRNHHMNDKGFEPSELDVSTTNKNAIRGREQQLIDKNGGAKSQGGTSGNAINGIGKNNKKKEIYLKAAEKEFEK
ncbi:RHS repeat-associated core domain-containing protein [Clostridium estertheticum]|nr:RHS repeat-associated core domain-containing protein [Clostridium estertheticum]